METYPTPGRHDSAQEIATISQAYPDGVHTAAELAVQEPGRRAGAEGEKVTLTLRGTLLSTRTDSNGLKLNIRGEQGGFFIWVNSESPDVDVRWHSRQATPSGSRQLSWAVYFHPHEIDALVSAAAGLYNATGDPGDVLSSRQRRLIRRVQHLRDVL